MATDWDAAFEDLPPDSGEDGSVGASRIHDTKSAFRERLAVEHLMDPSGVQNTHGVHKQGSFVSYFQADEPTTLPSGDALGDDSKSRGRLWSSEDGKISLYTSDGWVPPENRIDGATIPGNLTCDDLSVTGDLTVNGPLTVSQYASTLSNNATINIFATTPYPFFLVYGFYRVIVAVGAYGCFARTLRYTSTSGYIPGPAMLPTSGTFYSSDAGTGIRMYSIAEYGGFFYRLRNSTGVIRRIAITVVGTSLAVHI